MMMRRSAAGFAGVQDPAKRQSPFPETTSSPLERLLLQKRKDESLWENFFEKHRGIVYGICMKYVKNHDDALDLTQQSFINFFENYDSIRTSSQAYLKAIARNLSINFIHSQNRIDLTEGMDLITAGEGAAYGNAQSVGGAVQSALKKLDEYCRSYIYYISEGFKIHEIARIFGADEGKIRSDSARCRRRAIYAFYSTSQPDDKFSDIEHHFIDCYFKHAYWPKAKVMDRLRLSEKQFAVMHTEILRKLELYTT